MLELWYRLLDSVHGFFGRMGERLTRVTRWITSPIEGAFEATFGRLFRLFEGFERFDEFLLQLVKLVFWPFAALGRLGRRLMPSAVGDWYDDFQERLAKGALWFAEAINLDGVFRWLAWITKPIWVPIGGLLGFANAWLSTRSWIGMLWGLPILLLFLPFPIVFVNARIFKGNSVSTRYEIASREALEKGDYQKVRLLQGKLAQLGSTNVIGDYNTAEKLAQDGKIDEAYEMMQQISPIDQPGNIAGHFWIAQNLLMGKLPVPAEQVTELAAKHLDHLELLQVRVDQIKILRAMILARSNKLAEASAILLPLVDKNPQLTIELFRLAVTQNNLAAAREEAPRLITFMEDRAKKKLPLTETDYQFWSMAAEMKGDLAQMNRALEGWAKLNPESPVPATALASIRQQQFAKLYSDRLADREETLNMFREITKSNPQRAWIDAQVGLFYQHREFYPTARYILDELHQDATLSEPLVVSLGTYAAIAKDSPRAIEFLTRGTALDPKDPIAWNNLAWALSEQPQPEPRELKLAMEAADKSIALAPDESRFRETRGQIHRKLKHWPQAIEDLEFALNGMPNTPAIHQALAEAYDATGEQELAETHRASAGR